MNALLPTLPDHAAYWTAHAAFDFGPALTAIARRHGLSGPIARFATGGNVIASAGDTAVVKLLAPFFAEECERERASLVIVGGRLPLAVPRLLAEGELEGWPYLILERLPGGPLGAAWPAVGPEDRVRILRSLGAALAELHALPLPVDVSEVAIDLPTFVATQTDTAVRRQRSLGLSEPIATALPEAIAAAALDPRATPVLIHADMTSDNVLLDFRGDLPQATGWIDFGDAMLCDPEYDLVTPAVFICRGDRALVDALLDGYGIPPTGRDAALRRRLFAWTVLHRFANLPKYLQWAGCPEPRSLAEAENALWPIGASACD